MKIRQRQEDLDIPIQLKSIMNQLKCPNNHTIRRVCDNTGCQNPALFCGQKNCQQCTVMHVNCRSYHFIKFGKLVYKRSMGPLYEFMELINEAQITMIQNIQKQRRKISPSFSLNEAAFNIDKKHYRMIEDIFRHINSNAINGEQANELFRILGQRQIQETSRQHELFTTFTQQSQRIMKQYSLVKDWIYDSAFGHDFFKNKNKEKKEETLPLNSFVLRQKNLQTTLESLLNSNNKKISMFASLIQDQMIRQDKNLIKQAFFSSNFTLQNIFKASENGFSASRFHQICDNAQNTFTIIRNQFGKTFAGFATQKWFGDNIFKEDDSGSSFLLSFDEKIKLILSNKSKANYCSQSLGPTFGGDSNILKFFQSYDLLIGDKCNTNACSYHEIPRSYQFHQRTTDALNIFGVEKGKKFKILQYEVFKVIWLNNMTEIAQN